MLPANSLAFHLGTAQHRRARALGVAVLGGWLSLGCLSGDGDDGDQQDIDSTTTQCEPGTERCECDPAGDCTTGLACRSNVCVDLDEGADDESTDAAEQSSQSMGQRQETPVAAPEPANADEPLPNEDLDDDNRDEPDDTEPPPGSMDSSSTDTPMPQPSAGSVDAGAPLIPDVPPTSSPIPGEVLPPSGCGDGVREEFEICDDGNLVDGDGCAANCLGVELGFLCPSPGESCMPYAVCGDGIVAVTEQCDDANEASGDGCSEICTVELGFTCNSFQSESVCTPSTCGDGVQEGAESCDDGNAEDGDGCSAQCQREPNCEGTECVSACGDGDVAGEECDDRNTHSGDGCSSDCTVEPGFQCEGDDDGSHCHALCGDGVLALGEQCDDGINDSGYGECGPDCELTEYCGDGIVNGDEHCDPGTTEETGCVHCRLPDFR